jgi:protein tyrosine/serine phosphatase
MNRTTTPSLTGVPDTDAVAPHDHPDRRLGFTGAFNFRDLGGYATEDGRIVRWRTLYRADALHRLPDAELDELGALGVRTVLDLRTAKELEHGKFQADHLDITHLHLSVLAEIWSPEGLDLDAEPSVVLGQLYLQMLEVGAPAFAAALRVLADPAQVPAVFHCAAGKDRTGVLAALVLALLGVDEDTIAGDYALTAASMDKMMERLRRDRPEQLNIMNDQPSAFMQAPAGAMTFFLDGLRARHGSAEAYVSDIGVEPEAVADLRHNLLA